MVDEMDCDLRGLRARDEIAHARVLPSGQHVQRVHRLGPLAQARGDRVEAEERASGGHGRQRGADARSSRRPPVLVYRRPHVLPTTSANFLTALLLVVGGLLPIVNPVGSAPMFLAMTHGADEPTRATLALKVAINAFVLIMGVADLRRVRAEGVRPVGARRAGRGRRRAVRARLEPAQQRAAPPHAERARRRRRW